jgi:hypothetical protein
MNDFFSNMPKDLSLKCKEVFCQLSYMGRGSDARKIKVFNFAFWIGEDMKYESFYDQARKADLDDWRSELKDAHNRFHSGKYRPGRLICNTYDVDGFLHIEIPVDLFNAEQKKQVIKALFYSLD